jgi:hypothetical protein
MIGLKWACEGVKPLLEWPRSPFTAVAFPVHPDRTYRFPVVEKLGRTMMTSCATHLPSPLARLPRLALLTR